jgi:predicted helicase
LILYFVDGVCGSAKTFAAVRHAHRLAQLGKKVLFVQPSISLISQTLNDLASLTPEVRAIHGGTSDRVIADHRPHSPLTLLS